MGCYIIQFHRTMELTRLSLTQYFIQITDLLAGEYPAPYLSAFFTVELQLSNYRESEQSQPQNACKGTQRVCQQHLEPLEFQVCPFKMTEIFEIFDQSIKKSLKLIRTGQSDFVMTSPARSATRVVVNKPRS